MFRIAHLSDPHVGPLPRPRLRELMGKRLTGFINWHRGRDRAHDMELLAALVGDIRNQDAGSRSRAPAISPISGCRRNGTRPARFSKASVRRVRSASCRGNHDAYIEGALEGMLSVCGPFTSDDSGATGVFPYVRRRAHVGTGGSVFRDLRRPPSSPVDAWGRPRSMRRSGFWRNSGRRVCCRVVMIHHPPHVAGASAGRNLTDARKLEEMIARTGAELMLHGHNHIGTRGHDPGSRRADTGGRGLPSASSRGGHDRAFRAAYYLFDIAPSEDGFVIKAQMRGLRGDGTIAFL